MIENIKRIVVGRSILIAVIIIVFVICFFYWYFYYKNGKVGDDIKGGCWKTIRLSLYLFSKDGVYYIKAGRRSGENLNALCEACSHENEIDMLFANYYTIVDITYPEEENAEDEFHKYIINISHNLGPANFKQVAFNVDVDAMNVNNDLNSENYELLLGKGEAKEKKYLGIFNLLSDSLREDGEFREMYSERSWTYDNYTRIKDLDRATRHKRFYRRIDRRKFSDVKGVLAYKKMCERVGKDIQEDLATYITENAIGPEKFSRVLQAIDTNLDNDPRSATIGYISFLYTKFAGTSVEAFEHCGIQILSKLTFAIDGKFDVLIRVSLSTLAIILNRNVERIWLCFDEEERFKYVGERFFGGSKDEEVYYVEEAELTGFCKSLSEDVKTMIESRITLQDEREEYSFDNSQRPEFFVQATQRNPEKLDE